MRNLLRLYTYFRPHRGKLFLGLLSVVLAAAFGMTSPLMVNYAIEFGLDPQRIDNKVVAIDGNTRLLVFGCLAIILFAAGRGLAAFGQQYLGQIIGQDVAYDLRSEIYENLQSLSYSYHDKVQTGQVMSRITQDV
jgi:ATP-binding cassette subfamily B protein